MNESSRRPFMTTVPGKIIMSLAAGSLVFGITSLIRQSTIQGVLLSVLVGGIVLLIEFEESIEDLKLSQRKGLANFSEATRLYEKVQRSPADRADVDFLLNQVGDLGNDTHSLLLDLVNREIERLALFVKQIQEASRSRETVQSGNDQPFSITYNGEDREWLLALTSLARKSIDAISLSTIDAGVHDYDGGLWRSDLGHRYVELQRLAIRRELQIRRIFYFDRPEISQDEVFQGICAEQSAIGVNVRIIESSVLPQERTSLVSDFIVFDNCLAYETTSETALARGRRPERLTTSWSAKEEGVQDLLGRF